jgi:hypothetical protein
MQFFQEILYEHLKTKGTFSAKLEQKPRFLYEHLFKKGTFFKNVHTRLVTPQKPIGLSRIEGAIPDDFSPR